MPQETFYFYDLETSGFSAQSARIMQFAGQRTDANLQPIGEPHNVLIKMTPDVVPDPDAVMITGITPQQTISEGLTEYEFLRFFYEEICIPGTIFTGFNSVRFDDEFMRCLHYRNLHDPYEWAWKDNCSRWDMLDVVRMTRALRPDGIKWPVDSEGRPTNRLELITSINGLDHAKAHDALSDVGATIAVAALLKAKQPKLFSYLLGMRHKSAVADLIGKNEPVVYTSGKYQGEYGKTTVALPLFPHPKKQGVVVYDLRQDPTPYLRINQGEMAEALKWHPRDYEGLEIPVKTLQFNKCPAVAPLAVLDDASQKLISLDLKTVARHKKILADNQEWIKTLSTAFALHDAQQAEMFQNTSDVDCRMYDGFYENGDKTSMRLIRAAKPQDIAELASQFKDERLRVLAPLYKARNFPQALSDEERQEWDEFCRKRLLDGDQKSRLARYFQRIAELQAAASTTERQRYLLVELELYGQSIMPLED